MRANALLGAVFCLLLPSPLYAETLRYDEEKPVEITRIYQESRPLLDNPYAARRKAFDVYKEQATAPPTPQPVPTTKIADVSAATDAKPLKIIIPNLKVAHNQAPMVAGNVVAPGYSPQQQASAAPQEIVATPVAAPTRKAFPMNVGKMAPSIAASLPIPAPVAKAPPQTLEQIIARTEDSPPASKAEPAVKEKSSAKPKPTTVASLPPRNDTVRKVDSFIDSNKKIKIESATYQPSKIRTTRSIEAFVDPRVSPKDMSAATLIPDPIQVARSIEEEKAMRAVAQLSALSPSAGEPIAQTPLIDAPTALPPMPRIEPSKPAIAPAAIQPLITPQESFTQEIVATPVTPLAASTPNTKPTYYEAALDEVVEQVLGDDTNPKMSKPEVLTPVEKKLPAITKTPLAQPEPMITVEPETNLSPATKKIANKLPSNLDKKKKPGSEKVNIDRIHDYPPNVIDGTVAVTQEGPGYSIKIDNRQMKVNLDYELEKAYNALLTGETMTAIEIYKSVLNSDPSNRNALFGLATTYHRAGQIELARPLYAKLLAIDPKNRDALNNFLVLMADEAPEQALMQLKELEDRNPEFSPIPAQMAVIYQKLGDSAKASEKMFRAIALAPENLVYRYNLAIMLDKQQKYEEAAKLYKQLIDASMRGETIPGNRQKIQERLTFLSSNRR